MKKTFYMTGSAPEIFHKMLRSAYFRLLVMGVVLANGIITATMNFKHDDNAREFFYEKYYYIEVSELLNYQQKQSMDSKTKQLRTICFMENVSDCIYNFFGFRSSYKNLVPGFERVFQTFCSQV